MNFIFLALMFFPSIAFAQNIKIGLHDDLTKLYITANKPYEIIEDRSEEQGSFKTAVRILEKKAGEISFLRTSPQAANDLVIASAPDIVTTSSVIKIQCQDQQYKSLKIAEFDSEKFFANPDDYKIDASVKSEAKSSDMTKDCILGLRKNKYIKERYGKYRGSFLVIAKKDSFTLINDLDMEDYLKGVVPGEMPVSWPLEALKAQTVAARTYSYANIGRRSKLGYDLKSGVEDQMYQGYARETKQSNRAVKETSEIVMQDKSGDFVLAFYSSHAGRFSASPDDAWGLRPKSYLQPVEESSTKSFSWLKNYSYSQLNKKLADLQIGSIKSLLVIDRSLEARVTKILINGSKSQKLLTGEEFRHKLGLRSTDFEIISDSRQVTIKGFGFGHGIGMSQHGAKSLAESGLNFMEILRHYYRGVKLASAG